MTPQEFGRGCDALTDFVGWTVATFALVVVSWFVVKNIWLLFFMLGMATSAGVDMGAHCLKPVG